MVVDDPLLLSGHNPVMALSSVKSRIMASWRKTRYCRWYKSRIYTPLALPGSLWSTLVVQRNTPVGPVWVIRAQKRGVRDPLLVLGTVIKNGARKEAYTVANGSQESLWAYECAIIFEWVLVTNQYVILLW